MEKSTKAIIFFNWGAGLKDKQMTHHITESLTECIFYSDGPLLGRTDHHVELGVFSNSQLPN